MAAATVARNTSKPEENDEDKELQDELRLLVDKITGKDKLLIPSALDMLKFLIRTSTTSMTSVPKPLKYLAPHYEAIKKAYTSISDEHSKKKCADIISVLAMGPTGGDTAKVQRECLKYCMLGTQKSIADWGHEYVRQLETEIIEEWILTPKSSVRLLPLVRDIVKYDCKQHAEIQACDLLMEIDRLELLPLNIDKTIYERICLYLLSCAKYVDETESGKIIGLVTDQYLRFKQYAKALIIFMQTRNREMVKQVFMQCTDLALSRQLAFMVARQGFIFKLDEDVPNHDDLMNIMSNGHLSSYFQSFARELDVMEPKSPEEVYKIWLEPTPLRPSVLAENVDSARQNLASSIVNGFVNAGFGCDKLLTTEGGNKWIYRNREHGKVSATAALGVLHLWDVDGGLTPIDKYLYSTDEYVKAGALLALGLVNCRVRNECDPALALLAEYVGHSSELLKIQAIFGLGLAYAGNVREDVLALLIPAVEGAATAEIMGIASLACGLVAMGTSDGDVSSAILSKLVDMRETDAIKTCHARMAVLGLALCYLGCRDSIEATSEALEVFVEPFRTMSQTILQMCAYAGTGDVLIVQELLHIVGEKIEVPQDVKVQEKTSKTQMRKEKEKKSKQEWDSGIAQAAAVLGVAAVSAGEETGTEMVQRIFGNIGRYGDPGVRRAVPLAVALASVSCPHLSTIDLLTKYSHDSDEDMACNAIFALGIVGAGTNNARLAAGLRQLAVFHQRNAPQLFMVRLAQGLVHLGKGTLTLNPMHCDRQLVDYCAMAGILIPLVALLEPQSLILGRSHYFLYALATAMQPHWLITLDEELVSAPVTVRVGQAIDIVAKAGTPKTIAGIHTHATPVLLGCGERAELATDLYEAVAPTLEGICIVKKKDGVGY